MRPFVELHGLVRGLANPNPNPNVNINPKRKHRPKHGPKHRPCFGTAVDWAMRILPSYSCNGDATLDGVVKGDAGFVKLLWT